MNTKQAWIGVLASLALVFGFAGTSMAGIYQNSGMYLFTAGGNDKAKDVETIESAIEAWFSDNGYDDYSDIELSYYDKDESVNGQYSDEWTTNDPVDFYTVKAGKQYAVYWEDPSTTSGTWSTEDLLVGNGNIPAISHISFWTMSGGGNGGGGGGNAPVPEPSTVFLMGLGLAGLGVTSYRKHNRK